MIRPLSIIALLLAGCTGSTTPPPAVSADRATLVLTVQAEPKLGSKTPQGASAYTGRELGAQFDPVDYSDLGDIVIWIGSPTPRAAVHRSIGVGSLSVPFLAASLNDRLDIQNTGETPRALFVRGESGAVTDLGALAVSETHRLDLKEPGLCEIVDAKSNRTLGRAYVAPAYAVSPGAIRVTRSGQKLTFSDLPPGPAEIGSWHPRLPGQTRSIALEAGKVTQATIAVGVNSLPKVP